MLAGSPRLGRFTKFSTAVEKLVEISGFPAGLVRRTRQIPVFSAGNGPIQAFRHGFFPAIPVTSA